MIKKADDRTVGLTVARLALAVSMNEETSYVPEELLNDVRTFARTCGLQCLVAKALSVQGDKAAATEFEGCVTKSMFFQRDLMVIDEMLGKVPYSGAVLLKGGALKYQIYPDPALRPSVDIDLLVRPDDIYRVARRFMAKGFYIDDHAIVKRPVSGRMGYDIAMRHPELNMMIELHRGLTQQFRYAHPVDRIIMDAGPLPGLRNITAPSLPWQLVHGGIHMAQRGFKQGFKHLLDIYILKSRLNEDDMRKAIELAGICGAKKALKLSIEAADIAFGHKKSPWSWLFSDIGPQVLKPAIHVVPAQILTGPLTTDSIAYFTRAMVIKGALLPLDLAFQKVCKKN